MKKSNLPDSQKKRKLLFDEKIPRERLIAFGEMFLDEGRVNEAAELFLKASHKEGLDRLKALAIEQGDSFLYGLVSKDSQDGDLTEDWGNLGKKAMEHKKYSHALRAFRNSGDQELLKAAEEALKEVLSVDKT
jgi:cytochrome c-type biogenesis protein CcmH/NrfG